MRALLLAVWVAGCGPEPWRFDLPPGMPPPAVPDENPMTEAKVRLGSDLFFDPGLSGTGGLACAGCHVPARGFSDPQPRSVGATGDRHPRNAPGLVYAAYARPLTWVNPGLERLEQQILVPLFGEHPVELGLVGREAEVFSRLDRHRAGFAAAFPEDPQVNLPNLVDALASFVRSLPRFDSPYDRFVAGDESALTAEARLGLERFSAEGCDRCHAGPLFSDAFLVDAPWPYHPGTASQPGVAELTGRPEDFGLVRTPTLRDAGRTAPYLHDGSADTLDEAIERHAPLTDKSQMPSLVAFLEALTLPDVEPWSSNP